MSAFTKILGLVLGKEVISSTMDVSVGHGADDETLRRLGVRVQRDKWGKVVYIKETKRRPFFTTNDLDSSGKLPSNYKELRERRKKKREAEKRKGSCVGIPTSGIRDIWGL